MAALALALAAAPRARAACNTSVTINPGDGLQTTIINSPLPIAGGDHCIYLNSGTYTEDIVVNDLDIQFGDAFSRLVISSAAGATPVIVGNGASVLADIAATSVTLHGLSLIPANPVAVAVRVSSSGFRLEDTLIQDTGAKISGHGLQILAGGAELSDSFILADAPGVAALSVSTASTFTMLRTTASAVSGSGGIFTAVVNAQLSRAFFGSASGAHGLRLIDSSSNTIANSTFTYGGAESALTLTRSSNNFVTGSVLTAGNGQALWVESGSMMNSVFGSTFTNSGTAQPAIGLDFGSGYTSMDRVYALNAMGIGLRISAPGTFVHRSTMTSFSGSQFDGGIVLRGGSAQGSYIFRSRAHSTAGNGLLIDGFATQNLISFSSITSVGAAANTAALRIVSVSTNVIEGSIVTNSAGDGVQLLNVTSTTITGSSATAHVLAAVALSLDNASNNALATLMVYNTMGTASRFKFSDANAVTFSSFTTLGATGHALELSSSSLNAISDSYFVNRGAGGGGPSSALHLDGSMTASNTISRSTAATNAPGLPAYWVTDGVSNSVSRSGFHSLSGRAVHLEHSRFDSIALSTMTSASDNALFVASAGTATISGSFIDGYFGARVSESTGTTISDTAVRGRGGIPVTILHSVATTTLNNVLLVSTTPAITGLVTGGLSSGLLRFQGVVEARAAGIQIPVGKVELNFAHLKVGRDLTLNNPIPAAAAYGSTVTFDGAAGGVSHNKLTVGGGMTYFDALRVNAASVTFAAADGFTAGSLWNSVGGSTMAFQNSATQPFTIQHLRVQGGGPAGNQMIWLRSTVISSPWPAVIAGSSISYAGIYDSNATVTRVDANDGTSFPQGANNSALWNFQPFLTFGQQGQSYVEGSGWTGTIARSTAGYARIEIRAVSAGSTTVTSASWPVTLMNDDPNEPTIPNQPLVNGATIFAMSVPTAEPSPRNTLLFGSGSGFFPMTYMMTLPVYSGYFKKLLLLMPGESSAPGTASGKSGTPQSVILGSTITVTVRAVDPYWNLVSTGTDLVRITTTSANLPQQTNLTAGTTNFPYVVFAASSTSRFIIASDLTNATIASYTSAPFGVFSQTSSSPTVTISFTPNSVQSTLAGGISGTAADATGVTRVRVSVRQAFSPFQYYSWGAHNFTMGSTSFTAAALSAPNGPLTNWLAALPDADLQNNATYYVLALGDNGSGNASIAQTTFTFRSGSLSSGSSGDGQGTAVAASPISLETCQLLVASVTVNVGAAGIASGGAIAVHLPDNWQRPYYEDVGNDPPLNPGGAHVKSAYAYTLQLNPDSRGNVTLGGNWLVYDVGTALPANSQVTFTVRGWPGGGPASVGPQAFSVLTQGDAAGSLKPIAAQPSFTLIPGAARQLQFDPNMPLTVGSLQTSPTMQIVVTDYCGNSTNTASALQIAVNAGQFNQPDPTARFYASGGGLLGPSGLTMTIPGNANATPKFYYATSTTEQFQNLIATATMGGQQGFGGRFVRVLSSSVSLTGVSVDTGTLTAGAVTATMTPSGFQGAFINFSLNDPQLRWEVIVSTSNTTFWPELMHRFGAGNPGRTLSWQGINERDFPNRFMPPGGPYYVKIRAEGGVVENTSLRIYIAQSASVYGTVNSTGAFAYVQAFGPGVNYGNFAVASSTGYFQLFGLKHGQAYNIQATTAVVNQGQFLRLQSSSNNVTALNGGANIGAIPFPTPALLRTRVRIPNPAPYEFWGGLNVHTQDYSNGYYGTLHYVAGADNSDDGQQAFGGTASTWTIMGVLPGRYDIDMYLGQVGISSTVRNIDIPGTGYDLELTLPRKANMFGWAVLPSTTPWGTFVSVQATKKGDNRPSVFGGTWVQGDDPVIHATSNTWSLFGLDSGSWTVTARAFGFASVSSSVYISSSADVGIEGRGGFDLYLTSGGVIKGTINLIGDSSQLPALNHSNGQGLDIFVNAHNPKSFTSAGAQVHLSTHAVLASSTFSISGLDDGDYFMNLWLQGATPVQQTITVAGGVGNAVLNVQVNSAKAFLTVKLPNAAPPSEFRKVALFQAGSGGPSLRQDLVGGNTVQYFASSATWQSQALGAGYYQFTALYGPTGMYKSVNLPLSNGATAFATLDLSGSTYTISGSVVLAAEVSFASGTGFISVSSITGVLANSARADYCVMGSSLAVSTQTFHLELLPIGRRGFYGRPLERASAMGCGSPYVSNEVSGDSPNPFHVYIASISPDGSFAFRGVPPGTYLMRNPTDVDGLPASDELPAVRQIVNVSSNTTGLTFKIERGVAVGGTLSLPPGITGTRSFRVVLLDSSGVEVSSVYANINNANATTYRFDRVADGSYAVRVEDFGFPRSYGARPRTFKVSGADLLSENISLVQTGIIKGKLAVQQSLASSTTRQFLLIGANNLNLLPRSLRVFAEANPWFQGGYFQTQNFNCGGAAGAAGTGNCGGDALSLDENDQFVIGGVLPGVYDVRYESYNDPNDNASINLVRSRTPGVVVGEQRTTDIGTVNLSGATQVRGTVFDVNTSSPIPNVTVRAKPSVSGRSDHDHPSVTTDKNGSFMLVGLDPSVKLYDIYAGYREGTGNSDNLPPYELKVKPGVDITSITVVNFQLSPAPYSISGRIVVPAGGPPLTQPFGEGGEVRSPGAAIFLQKTTELPRDNPIADIQVATDQDGYFNVTALTAGSYKLVVASLDYSSLSRTITISTASVNLGTLSLGRGGTLTGQIRKPDGSNPSRREMHFLAAVTNDLSELLVGSLTKDPNTDTITAYSVSGFRPNVTYRLILGDEGDSFSTPDEARSIVFSTTTESRTLDFVLRPTRPFAFAKARKSGTNFLISLELSAPLRAKTSSDDDVTQLLSTFSAKGALSQIELSPGRSLLTAVYTPDVTESSFTLKLRAFSTVNNPDSLDLVNPEFMYLSTYTFFTGVAGYIKSTVPNVNGGTVLVEGDNGRVAIPSGAFAVDASSSVEVTMQVATELQTQTSALGAAVKRSAATNLASLSAGPAAYPSDMLGALAATPPEVSPFSGFYDILLPLGVRTALQKPVKMTVAYSSGTDPLTLNLYWYNAAANAYILQQDVTGAAPVIDTVNRTITINVNHFSTFVLFNAGVNVISGNSFSGGDFEAFNFPNPFDLSVKTVTALHNAAGPSSTIRGTMIRFSLPSDVSGDAAIRIFNVAGERVRTIELGTLTGGSYFYQAWDGRNDSGRDVASGVYIGQVKVGGRSKFFKMALIK